MEETPVVTTVGNVQVSWTQQRGFLFYVGYDIFRMSRNDTVRSTSISPYESNQINWIHLLSMLQNIVEQVEQSLPGVESCDLEMC